ncbi:uncharacterized protein LOC101857227 [Aplysia californica]|uniref:Uncharacterized protein LOC101857227 n=1 Tax=Aplysia californica TaxID=6500 RepID=A0ABM1AFT3_APLCA|nr:uncharacterized protein LOC101857227 [Aplysia californica]
MGSNSRPLDSTLGSRGRSGFFDSENSFDRQSTQSDFRNAGKSRSKRKSRRRHRDPDAEEDQSERRQDNDEVISVDMSVQTDDSSQTEKRRRRGRWRRGGLSEYRPGETDTWDESDYYDDEDEEEDNGEDYTGEDYEGGIRERRKKRESEDKEKGKEGLERASSGKFTEINYDLTPNMFRSETGGSEWSDDVPPLINAPPGRPKGASVHKFYERRDHVATVITDPSRGLYSGSSSLPSIEEPYTRPRDPLNRQGTAEEIADHDSDLHSESNYTDATLKVPDGVSVGDSGIGKDMLSEVSSHVYGGSDSLYQQGRPKLSPIKSQSNLQNPETKESEWKDFLESNQVQERHKAVDFVKKDLNEEPMIRIPTLPPIMYVDPEQPTLPGEAGLRLLYSVRLADREKTCDPGGRVVEALPGRLTISTQAEPAGDTNYGLLQMRWTTQVPALQTAPTGRRTNRHTDKRTDRQQSDLHKGDLATCRYDVPEKLPKLPRTDGVSQRPKLKSFTAREKTLPVLPTREQTDFQWSRPMAPAPKRASFADNSYQLEHHCDQYRWASRRMHHYISSTKNMQLPKMDGRAHTFLAASHNDDVMSIISHSSVALMPSMTEKLLKSMNAASSLG